MSTNVACSVSAPPPKDKGRKASAKRVPSPSPIDDEPYEEIDGMDAKEYVFSIIVSTLY